ncbi:MAG: PKD domain-containing protein, partial [Candidatus Lokiarchaeota archaeon]|nr:PKD domain-containing protein [Candidatus Lokiarchaeota archaeon]
VNDPPIAADDIYEINEDNDLYIVEPGIITNDVDIDGPQELTTYLYSDVSNGTLNLNLNGSFCYSPDINWHGIDLFMYQAYDGEDYSNLAKVYINVSSQNDQPIVYDIPDQEIDEGELFEQIYLGDYVEDIEDPDEDIEWSYSGNIELIIDISNRIATISTPHPDWYGQETIVFTATDTGGLNDSDDAMFNVNYVNDPPNKPINPNPFDDQEDVGLNPSLKVYVSDPNNDILNVSFYNADDDSLIGKKYNISSDGNTSIIWNGLSHDTTYNWYVIVNDSSLINQSETWSFTTQPSSGGGGGGGENNPPIADASAGEPYFGVVGEEIIFNGELSYDIDGYIQSYHWDFGDGADDTGVSPIHIYNDTGEYNVRLTVIDNLGLSDYYDTIATISQLNNPPSIPIVNGTNSGSTNISYEFSIVSTDIDNDSIKYVIDWEDGVINNSEFLPNGTKLNISHNWTTPGFYTISIYAVDVYNSSSDIIEIDISIDAILCDIIGYLIDLDSDGIYDRFHSYDNDNESIIKEENNYYLIDYNQDDKTDYAFNIESGLLDYADYVYQKYSNLFQDEIATPGFHVIIFFIAIIIFTIIIIRKN